MGGMGGVQQQAQIVYDQPISLRTSAAFKPIFDNVRARIVDLRWIIFQYLRRGETVPSATTLALKPVYQTADGQVHDQQVYSAGDPSRYQIMNDGFALASQHGSSVQGIPEGTNAYLWIQKLEEAGFPPALLDRNDLRVVIGTDVHLRRIPAPARNIQRAAPVGIAAPATQPEREDTVLVVVQIFALPGEAGQQQQQMVGQPPMGQQQVQAFGQQPTGVQATQQTFR